MLKQCVFGIVVKEGEIVETDQIYKITYIEGDIVDQIMKWEIESIEGVIAQRAGQHEIKMTDLRGSSSEGKIQKGNKFSFWHLTYYFNLVSIFLTWLISQFWFGWSIWFIINAKEGDCWNMIEVKAEIVGI